MAAHSVYDEIEEERLQLRQTREKYYKELSNIYGGRGIVTFFTSFNYPVQIQHDDCDTLINILRQTDLSRGLVLMINSPGGDDLAAERIVGACRAYSGTGDYWVLVPGRAKSAATIVCLGASKILMAPSSELGPVDPQILLREDGAEKEFSAFSLVKGYKSLFDAAVNTKGNIEIFAQQLARYDDREINKYEGWIALSKNIAIKVLSTGMLSNTPLADIEGRIKIFLEPEAGTQDHGRAISASEARDCGLTVEDLDLKSQTWACIYDLYYRADAYVSGRVAKLFESVTESFYETKPKRS